MRPAAQQFVLKRVEFDDVGILGSDRGPRRQFSGDQRVCGEEVPDVLASQRCDDETAAR